jgi:Mg-chelatase subunit ChlD
MAPLIGLLLPVLLILSCFVVNAAYMELTRMELRISSDAAARAAGYALQRTGDETSARTWARDAATRNPVARKKLQLADRDVVFGTADRASLNQRYVFSPTSGVRATAVRVTGRRDSGSLSGMVGMIMPTFGAVKQFGPRQVATVSQAEVDVALVVDRSGSMAYGVNENSDVLAAQNIMPASAPPGWDFGQTAPPGARWRDVVAATNVFVDAVNRSPQDERVALVTYGGDVSRETQLSTDLSGIAPGIDKTTKSLQRQRTGIGGGIQEGVAALNAPGYSRPWAVKLLLVLTDGRHNIGLDPETAVTAAFQSGITVYTITFSNDADQDRMKKIAVMGGGMHLHAPDGPALKKLFSDVVTGMPMLLVQ